MKKILLILSLVLGLTGLTACSEQTTSKVTYVKEMSDALPSLVRSYARLHALYANPLAHSPKEWTKEFRKNKSEIEDEYNEIKDLTPIEGLSEVHNSLLSVLELTIKTNNVIDEQIQKGEKIDYKAQLGKLKDWQTKLEKSVTSINDQIKNKQ